MALEIDRNDASRKERAAMADNSGKTAAAERIYETVDGRLVREGDPSGAFLKYGVGDPIADRHRKDYDELVEPEGETNKAYSDEQTFEEMSRKQARPDSREDPNRPILMHDRLATELADHARSVANRPVKERVEKLEQANEDQVYATEPVYRRLDGTLAREGDADATTLAYAPGDPISENDRDAYNKMSSSNDDEPSRRAASEDPNRVDADSGTKQATTPANKSTTTRRASTESTN